MSPTAGRYALFGSPEDTPDVETMLPRLILRERREHLRMTQGQLAERLGLRSVNFVSMLEAGKSEIPFARVVDLAAVLEVDPVWLLERVLGNPDRSDDQPVHQLLFAHGGAARAAYERGLRRTRKAFEEGRANRQQRLDVDNARPRELVIRDTPRIRRLTSRES
jgi:transcriptional regulator with XRE-family HTH domain